MFLSIFGTIAMDVFCVSDDKYKASVFSLTNKPQSIGPLLPTPDYTILESIVISSACYIAVACLATLLVFPQTTNHFCMSLISAQLSRIQGIITLQEEVLGSQPTDLTFDTPLMTKIRSARSDLIASQQQCKFGPNLMLDSVLHRVSSVFYDFYNQRRVQHGQVERR